MPPSPASPSPQRIGSLIFGDPTSDSTEDDGTLSDRNDPKVNEQTPQRPSIYVELFEDMIETVVKGESNLFVDAELKCLEDYSKLPSDARYLLVRLSLRKACRWIKLDSLHYQRDLGTAGILPALRGLCAGYSKRHGIADIKPKIEEQDISLADEAMTYATEGEPTLDVLPSQPDYTFFAQDETSATLEELLGCFTIKELKELAKQMNIKLKSHKRHSIVAALLSTASQQTTLSTDLEKADKGKDVLRPPAQRTLSNWCTDQHNPPQQQTTLNYPLLTKAGRVIDRLRDIALKKIGACIRVNNDVVKLLNRIHLVYFRSMTLTPLLTPSILARTQKWTFAHYSQPQIPPSIPSMLTAPSSTSVFSPVLSQSSSSSSTSSRQTLLYAHSTSFSTPPTSQPAQPHPPLALNEDAGQRPPPYARTCYRIWPTRDDLLAYERALALEARIDGLEKSSATSHPRSRSAGRSCSPSRAGSAVSTVVAKSENVDCPVTARSGTVFSGRPSESPLVNRANWSNSPAASRGNGRKQKDDEDEDFMEEDDDVLPVLKEDESAEDVGVTFDFLEQLIEVDDALWVEGKGKKKDLKDTPRVRAARQIVELGRQAFRVWCDIPQIREALDKAASGDIDEDPHPTWSSGAAMEDQEPMAADTEAEGEPVKSERWEAALQTRSQQARLAQRSLQETQESELRVEEELELGGKPSSLTQFHHGYILTRIVSKTAQALCILHQHKAALNIYTHLLAQRVFRRGRRGRWHDQRLLILMEHVPRITAVHERAWTYVHDALNDRDTHMVWWAKLERRRERIKKRLIKAAPGNAGADEDKSELYKAKTVLIKGVRVFPTDGPQVPGPASGAGRSPVKKRKLERKDEKQTTLDLFTASKDVKPKEEAPPPKPKPLTGKSIWIGKDDEHVTVEEFALEHYQSKGYKGLHSEGRVLTTLFALLFFDIILAPIPGAFETPYQSAPLDIACDTFYFARHDLIGTRLDEISSGQASEIALGTWDRESGRKTWCVGLKWDLLTREDWEEILACWNPKALKLVCETFAEDFVNRTSGVPDLFLWHNEEQECKFVEVKGPNDNLQENQKLWIDVFMRANANVEVCHVEEIDPKPKKKRKSSPKVILTPRHAYRTISTPATKSTPGSKSKPGFKPRTFKPKSSIKKELKEVIVISDSDSDSESNSTATSREVDYSQLDIPRKTEPRPKSTPQQAEVKRESTTTPRRSNRRRLPTRYRFDVEPEVVEILEASDDAPGPSSRKRKRAAGSP